MARESLISDVPSFEGKIANLFYSVWAEALEDRGGAGQRISTRLSRTLKELQRLTTRVGGRVSFKFVEDV
jgi:hypothetical protein